MGRDDRQRELPADGDAIASELFAGACRALVIGETGAGKSTLVTAVADACTRAGRPLAVVAADPGRPTFGVPGAVTRGTRSGGAWRVLEVAALCSLDAARFRLPLAVAVASVCRRDERLLVDAPGVSRGMAAAELLAALVAAGEIDTVLAVVPADEDPPLAAELASASARVVRIRAAPEARRPPPRARAKARTALWDAYLAAAAEHVLALERLPVVGAPPPEDAPSAWRGRQIALLDRRGATLVMGEVVERRATELVVRSPAPPPGAAALLVRDAHRDGEGLLTTAPASEQRARAGDPSSDMVPAAPAADVLRPDPVHVAAASVVLVNGVFGDPLLHVRLRERRQSFLFDLGDAARLQARITHQVTHVFVTHAHFDHFGGFLWLVRSRIGESGVCRLYGPPGLAGHAASMLGGIHWDRIGPDGPRFEVSELRADTLETWALRAGAEPASLGARRLAGGPLVSLPGLAVRATVLDHGIPVLAYALESEPKANIDDVRLRELGLEPGPWLEVLKRRARAGEWDAAVTLGSGEVRAASELRELVRVGAAEKLAYATDFADTAANRERLTRLARGAQVLVCEATFTGADADQAERTRHLTARACGEIASAAGVGVLVPFHFSRRYERDPECVYAEVRAAFPRTALPSWLPRLGPSPVAPSAGGGNRRAPEASPAASERGSPEH